jgi:hypothetical protein
MTWNIRLVDMSGPTHKAVELRKVHYEIMGNPISHTLFSYNGTDQAEINRLEKMVDEAFTKPVLKFAS